MNSVKMLRVMRVLLIAAFVAAGASACGDDVEDDGKYDAGAGNGGRGGRGGSGGSGGRGGSGGDGASGDVDAGVESPAADLRVTLNLLLSEHVSLAAKVTGAALGDRAEELDAYSDLLNQNGSAVSDLVGEAFGADAKTKFNAIWAAHNVYFVDYTTAVADNDETKKNDAVKKLTEEYVPDFAELLAAPTGLTEKAIADLAAEHVTTTAAIVDAQAAKDWPKVFSSYRTAFAHMRMIGDALSAAIAKKLPSDFKGDPAVPAVDFRVSFNQALQEHVYLATFATGAALGGDDRKAEFEAAHEALNKNGSDLGDSIGMLFGDSNKAAFNSVWKQHNDLFVNYTVGIIEEDDEKKTKAVDDLNKKYVPGFAMLLNLATELPLDMLKGLVSEHVVLTKAVVDLQAEKKPQDAAKADLKAAQHMQMLADPVVAGVVAGNAEKF